ncbi:MAG: hypothetical protein EOL89_08120 [Actinobacteria bacterium]|nr:hypothetical protein [Actinomycetota bacterium]
MTVKLAYDESLILEIASRFDLRDPNKRALDAVVKAIIAANGDFTEVVADLATGVGKTYLMSSLVEYLATQGVRHVLVVTPGSTIQRKTLANFDAASTKYVPGADIIPFVITPENFRSASVGAALRDPSRLKVFVFNVQQLIRPTANVSRKVRSDDETLGDALYDHLRNTGDLVVIADEHHVYHDKAAAFHDGVRGLDPLALVGLTATPDQDDYDTGKVIFQYTLGDAIADGYVKVPVIVYRQDGTKDEQTQLRDACDLLRRKEAAYDAYRSANPDAGDVKPVLFVVCQTIDHASEVGQQLARTGFIGDGSAVLEITSQSSDEALQALSDVEEPGSPIRAIVSVNMLREGWDVKNIAVITALRRLASQTLTEQILGRGLRLPFGKRTGVASVDQVDLVAHDSYEQLLAQKDVLAKRVQPAQPPVAVDETGAAVDVPVAPDSGDGPETTGGGGIPGGVVGPSAGTILEGLNGETADTDDMDEVAGGEDEMPGPSLHVRPVEERLAEPEPRNVCRVKGAPQIVFPRQEYRLSPVQFSLSDVESSAAERAGARFVGEIPSFIVRDALKARRGDDGSVEIVRERQDNAEVVQEVIPIDAVRGDLTNTILTQPEVPAERASKGGAERLVKAFLKGAGAAEDNATAEWGDLRRKQAVTAMRQVIRDAIDGRRRESRRVLVDVILPVEPVTVDGDVRDALNDKYAKNAYFQGWSKNIMPVASFDARTTEWKLAHLLDRDNQVRWWLRLYTNGPAYIPTDRGNYYPDFVVIDEDETRWVVEGKADARAQDADVQQKKAAAEKWARFVCDNDEHGTWRYLFATESDVAAAGSWANLVAITHPD